MRITDWIVGIFAVTTLLTLYDWTSARDSYQLHNDGVTACKPPRDQGEKLVATLYKSADGGPLTMHCTYHSTLNFAP
jgi:hypothetical protein